MTETLRVLIIEDNVDGADAMQMLLEHWGHDVQVVYEGAAALAAAKAQRPDVVLCDIGLPGTLDGYGVARAVRGDPGLAGTFLVALTGYAQEIDRQAADAAGFDAHLAKPVDTSTLEELLRSLAVSGTIARRTRAERRG